MTSAARKIEWQVYGIKPDGVEEHVALIRRYARATDFAARLNRIYEGWIFGVRLHRGF